MPVKDAYIAKLKERAQQSRVYKRHQLDGLEIAHMLGDERRVSLYMKLAKEQNGQKLRRLAKEIAENNSVKNKGAYFMTCLAAMKKGAPRSAAGQAPPTPSSRRARSINSGKAKKKEL